MLGNIGPMELVIVLLIVLVLFGAKRLPEMGASIGKGIREFKNSMSEVAAPTPTRVAIDAADLEMRQPKRLHGSSPETTHAQA